MMEHYIGVDLHQAFFQACAVHQSGARLWEDRFPRRRGHHRVCGAVRGLHSGRRQAARHVSLRGCDRAARRRATDRRLVKTHSSRYAKPITGKRAALDSFFGVPLFDYRPPGATHCAAASPEHAGAGAHAYPSAPPRRAVAPGIVELGASCDRMPCSIRSSYRRGRRPASRRLRRTSRRAASRNRGGRSRGADGRRLPIPSSMRLQRFPASAPCSRCSSAPRSVTRRFPTPGHLASYAAWCRAWTPAPAAIDTAASHDGIAVVALALVEPPCQSATPGSDRPLARRLAIRKGALKARVACARSLCDDYDGVAARRDVLSRSTVGLNMTPCVVP